MVKRGRQNKLSLPKSPGSEPKSQVRFLN